MQSLPISQNPRSNKASTTGLWVISMATPMTAGVAPVRAINQSHSSSIPAPPCATARSPKHSPRASTRQTWWLWLAQSMPTNHAISSDLARPAFQQGFDDRALGHFDGHPNDRGRGAGAGNQPIAQLLDPRAAMRNGSLAQAFSAGIDQANLVALARPVDADKPCNLFRSRKTRVPTRLRRPGSGSFRWPPQ